MLPTHNGSHLQTKALEMPRIIDPIKKIAGLDEAIDKLYDEYSKYCRSKGTSPLPRESLPNVTEGELDCLLNREQLEK